MPRNWGAADAWWRAPCILTIQYFPSYVLQTFSYHNMLCRNHHRVIVVSSMTTSLLISIDFNQSIRSIYSLLLPSISVLLTRVLIYIYICINIVDGAVLYNITTTAFTSSCRFYIYIIGGVYSHLYY